MREFPHKFLLFPSVILLHLPAVQYRRMLYVYRCPNVVKWPDRIMIHHVNVYLPNIYQSLSLSFFLSLFLSLSLSLSLFLFKRRATQNENLTDFVKGLATEIPEPIEFYFI